MDTNKLKFDSFSYKHCINSLTKSPHTAQNTFEVYDIVDDLPYLNHETTYS